MRPAVQQATVDRVPARRVVGHVHEQLLHVDAGAREIQREDQAVLVRVVV